MEFLFFTEDNLGWTCVLLGLPLLIDILAGISLFLLGFKSDKLTCYACWFKFEINSFAIISCFSYLSAYFDLIKFKLYYERFFIFKQPLF